MGLHSWPSTAIPASTQCACITQTNKLSVFKRFRIKKTQGIFGDRKETLRVSKIALVCSLLSIEVATISIHSSILQCKEEGIWSKLFSKGHIRSFWESLEIDKGSHDGRVATDVLVLECKASAKQANPKKCVVIHNSVFIFQYNSVYSAIILSHASQRDEWGVS